VRTWQRGYSLAEILTVVAIVGLFAMTAVPAFLTLQRRAALRSAAAQLRTIFHDNRSRAIARNRNCGLKFLRIDGEWKFAVYDDGDGDGVRNDDIKSGKDRLVAEPRVVFRESRAVRIGLLGEAIKDPDGDPLPPTKSPVAFNQSAICSFSPIGESTPGTIYLTEGGRELYAVRVYGATAKIRVLRYVRATKKWVS
jgi:prepilin-type N-terminal cleavage/methylation domain-containing protein